MLAEALEKNPGSFRDPAGYVYHINNRILRSVTNRGALDYLALKNSILESLIKDGWLVETKDVSDQGIGLELDCAFLLEHQKIPFISYPYEWSFDLLKKAALFHLDFHIKLLKENFTLKDASAYNVQFLNKKPIFIDLLSIKQYTKGEFWTGQKQFTEQFLIPLLLSSDIGVSYNNWYRGNLEGIMTAEFVNLLPWYRKYNPKYFMYITLPNQLQEKHIGSSEETIKNQVKNKSLSKKSYLAILGQLRSWIKSLEHKEPKRTNWSDYSHNNIYEDSEAKSKFEFVKSEVAKSKAQAVIDLGCNTGEYSKAAFEAGANSVIGFDFDKIAINNANKLYKDTPYNFLPLYIDATNPSPNLGWNNEERDSLSKRMKADFVIALAFIHHLVIAKNIDLTQAIKWILSIAPNGIIEYVDKDDPTIKKMLSIREDIFDDYTQESFENILSSNTKSYSKASVTKTGRILYSYKQ